MEVIFRKILASAVIAGAVMSGTAGAVHAQVPAPDFAYPKTVKAKAEKALKTAERKHDDRGVLTALMQMATAESLIDAETQQASLTDVLRHADAFADRQIRAVGQLYAATLADGMYRSRSWDYDRRKLPLSPRPADMTEWSGEMYRAYIDSLLHCAWAGAGDMPISDLKDMVKSDGVSRMYYPTLRHFAASQILSLGTADKAFADSVRTEIVAASGKDTRPWYNWRARFISESRMSQPEMQRSLIDLYAKSGDAFNALVIWYYVNPEVGKTSVYRILPLLAKAEADAQGTWMENTLKNLRDVLTSPSLKLTTPPVLPATAALKVRFRNLGALRLEFLKFASIKARDGYPGKSVPESRITKTFSLGEASPVDRDTTLTVTLPYGYYKVRAYTGGGAKMDNMQNVTVSNVAPAVLTVGENTVVSVNDAVTGAPVAGAKVSIGASKAGIIRGVTDAAGLIAAPSDVSGSVTVTSGGVRTYFEDLTVLSPRRSDRYTRSAEVSFTTQVGVYQPGDTVRWLGVVSNDGRPSPVPEMCVRLLNADGDSIDSATVAVDSFNRVSGSFVIPANTAKTGAFCLNANGEGLIGMRYFQVSDFRPAAVQIDGLRVEPQSASGTAFITGNVKNFAGTGLSGASLNALLSYGENSTVTTATADAQGAFSFTAKIPGGIPFDVWHSVTAEITATASGGEQAQQTCSFNPFKPYTLRIHTESQKGYRYKDVLKPLKFSVSIANAYGDSHSLPVNWRITDRADSTVLRGSGVSGAPMSIDISSLARAQYTLNVAPVDTMMAFPASTMLETFNPTAKTSGGSEVLFFPQNYLVTDSTGMAALQVCANHPDTYLNVYYVRQDSTPGVVSRILPQGFSTVELDADMLGAVSNSIEVAAIYGGNMSSQRYGIYQSKKALKDYTLVIENFRDKSTVGDRQNWQFRFETPEGKAVRAALAVNVHDGRLDLIAKPTCLEISGKHQRNLYLNVKIISDGHWYRRNNVTFSRSGKFLDQVVLYDPTWLYLPETIYAKTARKIFIRGRVGATADEAPVAMAMVESSSANMKMYGAQAKNVDLADSVEEEAVSGSVEAGSGDDSGLENVSLRSVRNFAALWLPDLVTDDRGVADVPFTLPDAPTTWALSAIAWDEKGNSARLERKIIASKPVLVSANAPRFAREGDSFAVMTTVTNATDSVRSVTVGVEAYADSIGGKRIAAVRRVIAIPANTDSVVSLAIEEVGPAGSTIVLVARAANNGIGDGEKISIPVLESMTSVTEARNFYMNPGERSRSMVLPAAQGTDFSTTLTFTENPMWTVVEALPVLTGKDVWPTAEAQSAAYFSAAVALGLMKQHPELEYTFKASDLMKTMRTARENLRSLQTDEGGWRWGQWSTKCNVWSTSAVLDNMAVLKRAGFLDDKEMERMIARALEYYDGAVRGTDLRYTLTRPAFKSTVQSLNGRKVSDKTIQWIVKDWKTMDVPTKALAACALEYNGNPNMAKTLIGSLDEFGTMTPAKGFEFKNVRSLQVYAWLLEAYGAVTPRSPYVDGLRQFLIVNKQGADWGNGIVTSYVVAAMINSGTPWTSASSGTTVSVDGKEIPAASNNRSGAVSVPVEGSELLLTRSGDVRTPAYGAVVTRFNSDAASVKAFSDGEVSIEKSFMIVRDGKVYDADDMTFTVGDRVRVLLTVKSSRQLSHLVITDQRAAALEPVEQLLGWVYADGVAAYRENRDAATNLYIDNIGKGTYQLTYDMTVNNAGTFSSGIATVTCTQAPSLTAHSGGVMMRVSPMSR